MEWKTPELLEYTMEEGLEKIPEDAKGTNGMCSGIVLGACSLGTSFFAIFCDTGSIMIVPSGDCKTSNVRIS
jgi:hypothetical protein